MPAKLCASESDDGLAWKALGCLTRTSPWKPREIRKVTFAHAAKSRFLRLEIESLERGNIVRIEELKILYQ